MAEGHTEHGQSRPEGWTMEQDWWQQAITPPDVVEITLKVGIIPAADHVQWMIEAKDPRTGVLLGQVSNPHGTFTEYTAHLEEAVTRFRVEALQIVNPF